MTVTVDVDELRIGMFVHLDGGWMSHPFPLSSFKITNAEQIRTLQSLGLDAVRWSPERSDLPADAETDAQVKKAEPAQPERPEPALSPAERARASKAARLAQQLDAMRLCERQFAEACRDLRRIQDQVAADPQQARESTQALAGALLDKMLVDGDLCVRVLDAPQGDRLSTHAMNVTVISLMLARSLGLAPADTLELGVGALLHDVGKLSLPDRVRLPHENFTSAEQALYRDHVAHGVVLGRRMALSSGALLIIAQHHELADGSGYPTAVKLDKMAILARVVSMVNHYDNLCNANSPQHALTPHEALSRMFAQLRDKFDATLLNAFIRMMGIYPPGSLVQLSDDRFAMVMSVNSSRPLKPRVLVFDPAVAADQSLYLNLETTPDLGIRRSLRSQQLPARAVDYLAPRPRVAYYFDIEAAPAEAA